MAGLNCRVGRRVASAKYKIEAALKTYLKPERTCLGKEHCNLDATSFGDECTTCKTIQ